jgi:UDP-N-acetylmuramate dehydrogenase
LMPDAAHEAVMSLSDSVQAAVAALGGLVEDGGIAQRDVPIGPMTTYRVGGRSDILVEVTSATDLERVGDAVQRSGLPVLVLGRGSNILVADSGFRGIVVSVGALTQTLDIDRATSVATASAGVLLPVLARKTAAAGLTGFEWAVGVPGSIGGAVRMNAGGHGSDMAASLIDITIADLTSASGQLKRTMSQNEVGLRFRGSALSPAVVVLAARLQLAQGDRGFSEREISEIVAWRRANQPGGQNAGSVFVNPVPGEVSAGALIDSVGLRGLRVGTAVVSDKHANFIQSAENGSADDVRSLMRLVQQRVEESTGYVMRSEIRLVGFEDQ